MKIQKYQVPNKYTWVLDTFVIVDTVLYSKGYMIIYSYIIYFKNYILKTIVMRNVLSTGNPHRYLKANKQEFKYGSTSQIFKYQAMESCLGRFYASLLSSSGRLAK